MLVGGAAIVCGLAGALGGGTSPQSDPLPLRGLTIVALAAVAYAAAFTPVGYLASTLALAAVLTFAFVRERRVGVARAARASPPDRRALRRLHERLLHPASAREHVPIDAAPSSAISSRGTSWRHSARGPSPGCSSGRCRESGRRSASDCCYHLPISSLLRTRCSFIRACTKRRSTVDRSPRSRCARRERRIPRPRFRRLPDASERRSAARVRILAVVGDLRLVRRHRGALSVDRTDLASGARVEPARPTRCWASSA